jgi:hypothetical protein
MMADGEDPWAVFRDPRLPPPVVMTPEMRDQPPTVVPAPGQPDAWAQFRVAPPAAPAAPPLDKYQQAAKETYDRSMAAGAPQPGYADRAALGAGLGWTDEFVAAGTTPIEMYRHGTWDPREGYNYAKALSDQYAAKTKENTKGFWGGAAELAGGLSTGAGVFGGPKAAAVPMVEDASKGAKTAYNYGSNILKGAGFGAVAGAGEGNTAEERIAHAKMGGVLGGGAAAALPLVGPVANWGGRILQMSRLRAADNVSIEQVEKMARDSGQTMDQVLQKIANAHAAGQTEYTLADALGKEGQRGLAAVAKQPGPARERVTEALTTRDLGMPIRVGSQVGTALGAPASAKQATTALIDQAETAARPLYQRAEQVGHPVWNNVMEDIFKTPEAKAGLAEGVAVQRIRNAGTNAPFNPEDAAITGFDKAGDPIISGVPNMKTIHTLKVGLDGLIEKETDAITGKMTNRGAALVGMKNRLLEQVDAMNPAYAEARREFAGPMAVKDAVQTGREMPTRGRHTDTLQAFEAMPPTEQQGVRIGYADAVRDPLERTGNMPTILREKSPKGVAELDRLSLYQGPRQPGQPDQLRQFLNREEDMQRTSKAALGGPATAENLADMASAPAGGEVVGMITNAAHGNPGGFIRNAYEFGLRASKGQSESQRDAIAKVLLAKESDETRQIADRIAAYDLGRRGVNPWTGRYRIPQGQ